MFACRAAFWFPIWNTSFPTKEGSASHPCRPFSEQQLVIRKQSEVSFSLQSLFRMISNSFSYLCICLKSITSIFLTFLIFHSGYNIFLCSQEKPAQVKVYSENRQQFSFPWAGGMNSCQFGKLDINLDG